MKNKKFFLNKTFQFITIILIFCSFEPTDIVFKNINLIPELLDNKDNIPHLPDSYLKDKTEKIFKQPVLPSIDGEKVADRVIDIKGILNKTIITTKSDLKKIIPNEDSIDYMFNLSNLGLRKKDGKKDKKGSGIQIGFLESEAKKVKIPFINDVTPVEQMPKKLPLPPGLNNEAKKMEIKNPITDIQINSIDTVFPDKVGASLKKSDYDFDPYIHFFDDFIDPDDVLNTNILDIIP